MDALTEAVNLARECGFAGVAVIHQGGKTATEYLAMCMSRGGQPCDPRNYLLHRTAEESLADLKYKLGTLRDHQEKAKAKANVGAAV